PDPSPHRPRPLPRRGRTGRGSHSRRGDRPPANDTVACVGARVGTRVAVAGDGHPLASRLRATMAERFASATEPADADIVVSVASTADGVTRLLETCSPRSRLVHISSALVYGPQPSGTTAAPGAASPLPPVPNH